MSLKCPDHALVEWLYEEGSVGWQKNNFHSLRRVLLSVGMPRSIIEDKENLERYPLICQIIFHLH